MRVIFKNCAVLGLLAALAGCAANNERYPSLALRPFETGAVPVAAAQPAAPIRPVISAETLGALRSKAMAAHSAFLSRETAAAPIIRAGMGRSIESNARAAALVALAELSSQRGATSAVLADLDQLAVDAATALATDPAITAAQTDVAALLARQDDGIARLWEKLGT